MTPTTHAADSPFLAGIKLPGPFTLVLFGATGDLAARKLFPSLAGLFASGFLPSDFTILGIGRKPKTDDAFRKEVAGSLAEFRRDGAGTEEFLAHIAYQPADANEPESFPPLAERLAALGKDRERVFYLATDPQFFAPIAAGLASADLLSQGTARVVIEKPFGHDLDSALALDRDLAQFLKPEQLYRIDHYLGKDTVQNLLAFRFGNALFEPLFHRQHIDHVQITVAETVGMEGKRGSFYDRAGALRDVMQNHMLQLLALITMEPPATLSARDITDAKLLSLRSLVPIDKKSSARRAVRAQYAAGTIDGEPARGYREEEGVAPDSRTETYVALHAEIENWRWAGVPFLLRTGKRLARRVTEIAISFKLPPLRLFRTLECTGDFCDLTDAQPNVLSFQIQPQEGIAISFSAKRPGMSLDLNRVCLTFDYRSAFQKPLPEAYERLLLDALRGDPSLFMRSNELEASWRFVTPILKAWAADESPPPTYAASSWGPSEASQLPKAVGTSWRQPG
jgi:glucose-6-phosphate 1-dehydrogenase